MLFIFSRMTHTVSIIWKPSYNYNKKKMHCLLSSSLQQGHLKSQKHVLNNKKKTVILVINPWCQNKMQIDTPHWNQRHSDFQSGKTKCLIHLTVNNILILHSCVAHHYAILQLLIYASSVHMIQTSASGKESFQYK